MSTIYLPSTIVNGTYKENVLKEYNKYEAEIKKTGEKENLLSDDAKQAKKWFDALQKFDSAEPVSFDVIKGYCNRYREKLLSVSYFIDLPESYPTEEFIDLTDECISLQIDGSVIDSVLRNSGFVNFIALLGVDGTHFTFSLVGADLYDPTRISSLYRGSDVQGIETWPSRGVLGMTRDYNDVLDCN